ncbi:MAG: DUF2062 domain-containing protein [Planctomycetaceae bacterium]|nr:DUF2062 domain-containing protein [Planctomycetaceae bacterium]
MRPILRFIRTRFLHIDDSPERAARGFAIGLFVGFLPLLGLHMIFAWFFAGFSRANRVIAMATVWFSNPVTAVFIYFPCYRLGRFLLSPANSQIDSEQMEQLITATFSAQRVFANLFTSQFWKDVYALSMKIGLETLIGGVILGLIIGKIGYWLSLYIIKRYRQRKHHFFRKLALRRQQLAD